MTASDLESAVVLSVAELASMAGMERRRFHRMLATGGVDIIRSGNRFLVSRTDLRDSLPKVYEALLERVHQASGE
jgi:hypothetical protein